MKDQALFFSQFGGNAADRFALTSPLETRAVADHSALSEYLQLCARHTSFSHAKVVVLIPYVAGLVGALATKDIRNHKGYRVLLLMAAVCFPCWMLIDRQVQAFYLIHFVMLMARIFAFGFRGVGTPPHPRALQSRACCCVVVGVQLATTGQPHLTKRVPQRLFSDHQLPEGRTRRVRDSSSEAPNWPSDWDSDRQRSGRLPPRLSKPQKAGLSS